MLKLRLSGSTLTESTRTKASATSILPPWKFQSHIVTKIGESDLEGILGRQYSRPDGSWRAGAKPGLGSKAVPSPDSQWEDCIVYHKGAGV